MPFLGLAGSPCAHPHHSILLLHSFNTRQTVLSNGNSSKLRADTISSLLPSMGLNLLWPLNICGRNEWINETTKRKKSSSAQPGKTIQRPGGRKQQLQARFSWHGNHISGCVHGSKVRVSPTSGWSPLPFVMAIDGTPNPENGCYESQGNVWENITPGNNPWVSTSWQLNYRLNKVLSPSRSQQPCGKLEDISQQRLFFVHLGTHWPVALHSETGLGGNPQVLLDIFLYPSSSASICNSPFLHAFLPGST